MIKIPNDIPRCHPLHESTSPGVTGTGIAGAGITKASSHGSFRATSSGSPSYVEETASGIAELTSCWITGASAGSTALHGTMRVAGSSTFGTNGPSAESTSPRIAVSTTSASPGIPPAAFESHLGTKLSNETDRQEEVHTLTAAEDSCRQTPRQDLRDQHRNQESLAISLALITRKPTSGFLSFLTGEPINIGAKTQRLVAA